MKTASQLAVPGSAWQQLIYYRKDLFAEAGLKAPRTYADIIAAARKLDSPELAGIVAANKTGQGFTQQSFEHIAQGNGCEMVDAKGRITFDSPQCVAALGFYRDLLKDYSMPGAQDIDTVRAAYFAGKAAMAIWPTQMLDELAGTRIDARPSCPECSKDPLFLARNTGVVAGLQGPDGQRPAHFGEVISWTVTADSDTEPARRFVEYFLTDGYADWLAIAPEERVPVRSGSAANPPSTRMPGCPFPWQREGLSGSAASTERTFSPPCCRGPRTWSTGGVSRATATLPVLL